MADEAERARAVATVVANKFFIHTNEGLVRVAFGEVIQGSDPHYHFAAAMTDQDWNDLVQTVDRLRRERRRGAKADA